MVFYVQSPRGLSFSAGREMKTEHSSDQGPALDFRPRTAIPGLGVDLGGLFCAPLWGGRLRLTLSLGRKLWIPLTMRPLLVKGPWGTGILDPSVGDPDPLRWRKFSVEPPAPSLEEQLQAFGLGPEDVDFLFLSHLHFDHAGGALRGGRARFPRAEILLHKAEWREALDRDRAGGLARRVARAYQPGRIRLLEGEEGEVFPGFHPLHTPGHTGGLMVVRLAGSREEGWFTSDLLPVTRSFRLQRDGYSDEDPDLALRFRREVGAAMARKGSLAFLYHDPRSWVARILSPGEPARVAGIACLARG